MLPAAFAIMASLLVMASLWSWGVALKKLFLRRPLLDYEPREMPRWGLIDLCLVVALSVMLQFLAVALVGAPETARKDASQSDTGQTATGQAGADETAADETTDDKTDDKTGNRTDDDRTGGEAPAERGADSVATRWQLNVLSGLASLMACGLGGLLIVLRTGSRWGADLGLTLRRAGRDVAYGIIAYVMLAPIIYSIQSILQYWYPSEHPLIESFRANPTWTFYLVCVFSAAMVAPTVEEFVCRVLLQGWLERLFAANSLEQALFPTTDPRPPSPAPTAEGDWPPGASPPGWNRVAGELADHRSGDDRRVDDRRVDERRVDERPVAERPVAERPVDGAADRPPSRFPIVISSLVFALLHWGNGLDPIPLFVLALGLGYLYQRTHRILPCVVLHFLVNAFALAVLAISVVAT